MLIKATARKTFGFFIILFGFATTQSQNLIVLDSVTSQAIPFAIIRTDISSGFYTNEEGELKKAFLQDSIKIVHISSMGYKTKIYPIVNRTLNDTIYLAEHIESLKEVLISTHRTKEKILGYAKKAKALTWNINSKHELATYIKLNKTIENNRIKSILIPIDKKRMVEIDGTWKKLPQDFTSVFRLNIYSVKDDFPNECLLSKPKLVNCNQDSDEILVIDISDENIKFDRNGLFITIEMIGEIKENNSLVNEDNPLPGFQFTKKSSSDFVSKSYYKSVFTNGWQNIKEDKSFSFLRENKFNLAIGVILNINKD